MERNGSEAGRRPKGRSGATALLANSMLLLFATLVSLLCAEIAVRTLGLAPEIIPVTKGRFRLSPNVKIGYEPIPNIHHEADSLHFYQYRGSSNELGYRGPIYPNAKAPQTFRIVVIGDSIVEGIGIDNYADLFTAKIESALRERGVAAEVLNFGVSGYNTQQEVETLKDKALRFDPDLVLLTYCLNDTASPDFWMLKPLLDEANEKNQVDLSQSFESRYLVGSALYRVLRFQVFAPDESEREDLTFKPYATGNTVTPYAKEFAVLAEEHGFEPLVIVFPHFTDRTFANYAYDEKHDYIRGIANEVKLPLLDLLPTYRACRAKTDAPLDRDNLHPNALGHTCAANAITEFIVEHYFSNREAAAS